MMAALLVEDMCCSACMGMEPSSGEYCQYGICGNVRVRCPKCHKFNHSAKSYCTKCGTFLPLEPGGFDYRDAINCQSVSLREDLRLEKVTSANGLQSLAPDYLPYPISGGGTIVLPTNSFGEFGLVTVIDDGESVTPELQDKFTVSDSAVAHIGGSPAYSRPYFYFPANGKILRLHCEKHKMDVSCNLDGFKPRMHTPLIIQRVAEKGKYYHWIHAVGYENMYSLFLDPISPHAVKTFTTQLPFDRDENIWVPLIISDELFALSDRGRLASMRVSLEEPLNGEPFKIICGGQDGYSSFFAPGLLDNDNDNVIATLCQSQRGLAAAFWKRGDGNWSYVELSRKKVREEDSLWCPPITFRGNLVYSTFSGAFALSGYKYAQGCPWGDNPAFPLDHRFSVTLKDLICWAVGLKGESNFSLFMGVPPFSPETPKQLRLKGTLLQRPFVAAGRVFLITTEGIQCVRF